jgi:hypothetical protein
VGVLAAAVGLLCALLPGLHVAEYRGHDGGAAAQETRATGDCHGRMLRAGISYAARLLRISLSPFVRDQDPVASSSDLALAGHLEAEFGHATTSSLKPETL